jgi:hypothetical protein
VVVPRDGVETLEDEVLDPTNASRVHHHLSFPEAVIQTLDPRFRGDDEEWPDDVRN